MKNVFKWRVISSKYVYLTDEQNVGPFIFNKIDGSRTYETGTITTTVPNDGLIGDVVSKLTLGEYTVLFNRLKALCATDEEASKLIFLSADKYFNIDAEECVTQAITPVCEGYDPIVSVSAVTVESTEPASANLEVRQLETDKTIHYDLTINIPKGEKGEKGDSCTVGLKGETGDPGKDAQFGTVVATAKSGETASVKAITGKTGEALDILFEFTIPQGPKGLAGINGSDGNDGKDSKIRNVTASATTLEYGSLPQVNVKKTTYQSDNTYDFDFDFQIPQGNTGPQGPIGKPAIISGCTASAISIASGLTPSVTATTYCTSVEDNKYLIDFKFAIPKGRDGKDGKDVSGGTGGYVYNFSGRTIEYTATEPMLDWDEWEYPKGYKNEILTLYYPDSWGTGGGTAKVRGYVWKSNVNSFAEGDTGITEPTVVGVQYQPQATGRRSHAEGIATSATTWGAHAEGQKTEASGKYSHAEGDHSNASGCGSHAEGFYTKANGDYSHAEGYATSAVTNYSHAEGFKTKSNGLYSHSEGNGTYANGECAHTEGYATSAVTNYSHSEGNGSYAKGECSHAEGNGTYAKGDYSHAEGYGNTYEFGIITSIEVDSLGIPIYGINKTSSFTNIPNAEIYSVNTQNYGLLVSKSFSYDSTTNKLHMDDENFKNQVAINDKIFIKRGVSYGDASHNQGYECSSYYDYNFVIGKFNKNELDVPFMIGDGNNANDLSNCFYVEWDGKTHLESIEKIDNGGAANEYFATDGSIGTIPTAALNIPSLPSNDNKTYHLTCKNGVLTWVEGTV